MPYLSILGISVLHQEGLEFFKLNDTIAVSIKLANQGFEVCIVSLKAHLGEHTGQLSLRKNTITICVKLSKYFSQNELLGVLFAAHLHQIQSNSINECLGILVMNLKMTIL